MKVSIKYERLQSLLIVASILLSVASVASTLVVGVAAYTGVAKPMEFYFHYSSAPVHVAGLETHYILNTSKVFQDYNNSFYKPVGLPKIVVDFYLYPNFAGPVEINGSWQVFIWANSSAYKPATFSLRFKEITVGGAVLWDSGLLTPTVTSTIESYLDVPVYCYNLTVPLAHAFSAGSTLLVEVEVNAGSSADIRIWFDSPQFPSKAILPARDYARPAWIKTYSVDGSETNMFYYNVSENERKVIVRVNVTDPFGGYDIYKVNITIIDPEGNRVIDNNDMFRVSNGLWFIKYSNVFELNWTYPSTVPLGNYTIIVTVIDNNGYYHYVETGTYQPFIEEETHTFTMGIIVYYNPSFLITDDVGDPLPEAQVYVTWRNGTTDRLPRYTSANGYINLTNIQPGSYGFTILWKDVIVSQTTIHVDSNGPYTIRTKVYQLTVNLYGNDGKPIHGAYVIVYTMSGVGYGLDITDAAGKATFKLPSGTYRIEAYYTTDYWLTTVKSTATEQATITSSTTKNIILTNFPPAIWTTTGFLLLIAIIIAAMIAVAYAIIAIHRKAHQ
ncbi:MAG: hypothetical protein QXH20_02650 [Candidatus Bathyarchaeia archaeon]